MSTVSLATAQTRAGGRIVVSVVDKPANVLNTATAVVGTPANPNPGPGTGPGEVATTVRTWVLASADNPALVVEVAEAPAESDPSVEARLVTAGATCRAQAPTLVVRATAVAVELDTKAGAP